MLDRPARPELHRHTVEAGDAEVREGHPPQSADDAERRQGRIDQREPQFGIGEERRVPQELEVVVAAQL